MESAEPQHTRACTNTEQKESPCTTKSYNQVYCNQMDHNRQQSTSDAIPVNVMESGHQPHIAQFSEASKTRKSTNEKAVGRYCSGFAVCQRAPPKHEKQQGRHYNSAY